MIYSPKVVVLVEGNSENKLTSKQRIIFVVGSSFNTFYPNTLRPRPKVPKVSILKSLEKRRC